MNKDLGWDLELNNGEMTKVTLNFYSLYMLREGGDKSKAIYNRFQNIRMNGAKDELDQAYIAYTGYVCAHLDEEYMDFVDFLRELPPDRSSLINAIQMLLEPEAKKKLTLQKYSKKRQEKATNE